MLQVKYGLGVLRAAVIFIVAFSVRLMHVLQMQGTPYFDVLMGDAKAYDRWARALAAGDWIGRDVFYQAPLYPYFLGVIYALAGTDLLVARVIQALVGATSCVLLGAAVSRLVSPRAGLAAGLALALWAPAIFFDGLLQKSVLDVFFVCLALWLISRIAPQRSRWAWLALGATMGALALTRENALALGAVLAVWAAWRPDRRVALAAFVAGLIVVLAPVVARHYMIDGGVYLTTSQFGPNFYIGNNPRADGTYASIRFGRGSPEYERLDATEEAETAAGRRLTPAEVSSYWTRQALGFIASEPLAWLKLMGRKALLLVNRSEMLDTESLESYSDWSTVLWLTSWYSHFGLLVPMAVAGALVTWRAARRRDAAPPAASGLWVVAALTLAYAASVMVFYVFARYRYPLVPFLLIFAATLVEPRTRAGARPFARAAAIGPLVVIAAAVAANWPLLSPALMRAITENNLATELQEAGRHDEAVARYRRAVELEPGFATARINLANALLARGDAGGAVDHYRAALPQTPPSASAQNNFGTALAATGDRDAAIAAFRAALRIDPDSALAHRNLGNLLVDAGAHSEGRAHLERSVQLAPADPEAVYDLATVLLAEERFDAAATRFATALRLRPDWPEAHNNLGIALASQGRIAEALPHFERAVALAPGFAQASANRDQAKAALQR